MSDMTPPTYATADGDRPRGRRVAVMQPYLFPYAGYFRLFHMVDLFVMYDCVQFPRRGRVHRTEITRRDARPAWLTLPLARQPRDTRIKDLHFADGARATFDERVKDLDHLGTPTSAQAERVLEFLHAPLNGVVDFLEEGLRLVCDLLGLPFKVSRSSTLGLDDGLRGQARVLAIAEAHGAHTYVNAPGGTALYDPDGFRARGIDLRFLTPYDGRFMRMLPALLTIDAAAIADDVRSTSRLLES
jgi:hypothetical protein